MKIDDMMLERIIELAVGAGYKPKEFDGSIAAILHNATQETMLTRFAYKIAKELEN